MSAAYARLVALAEHEWALICSQSWEQLDAVTAERSAIVAGLPAVAPPEAAGSLHRLGELQALTSAALTAARRDSAPALTRLASSRGALQGYAASAAQRPFATP